MSVRVKNELAQLEWHVGSIFVSQVTHRATKSRAEINYARSIADLRASCQFIGSREAAIMILFVWK